MIKSARMLQPILVEFENDQKMFFLDLNDQKILDSNLSKVEENLELNILLNINNDNDNDNNSMPFKEIYDAMSIEKKLIEENDKHIFRRN